MTEPEVDLRDRIAGIARLAIRRRWWIIATALGVTLATVAGVFYLPDRYSSEATIVVVEQQVSQAFAPSAATTSVYDVVTSMTREILSRTKLIAIIDEFGLYAKDRNRMSAEGMSAKMRKDVDVEPLDPSNFGAFKISFTADDPQLAQRVTKRLAELFLDEDSKTRENQTNRTDGFLADRLDAAKQNLERQEQRLRDFKMSNLGELPEQQGVNLGILTDLRVQRNNITANLSRAQQQRAFLESALAGNVARLGSERSTLLAQFTPKHPEVLKKDREIAVVEALITRVKTGAHETDDRLSLENPAIAQLRNQVDANIAEIAKLSKEEQSVKQEIGRQNYQVKLTPLREQQLAGILRDLELYRRDYSDLMSKQLQSKLTSSVEKRHEGRHFRLIDPPTEAVSTTRSKRLKISLGGAVAGILLGFALAILIDSRDRSFHSEEELIRCFSLPSVGVPVLFTDAEESKRTLKTKFEWAAGLASVVAVVVAQVYVFMRG